MKMAKRHYRSILFLPREELKIVLQFYSYIVFNRILVGFIPLKYYFTNYFSFSDLPDINLQPYHKEISYFNKIKKHSKIKISCLVESMVMFCYFKRKHNIVIPIRIGVSVKDDFQAHAWYQGRNTINEFQEIEYEYKE